jgi:hypothetical protein
MADTAVADVHVFVSLEGLIHLGVLYNRIYPFQSSPSSLLIPTLRVDLA